MRITLRGREDRPGAGELSLAGRIGERAAYWSAMGTTDSTSSSARGGCVLGVHQQLGNVRPDDVRLVSLAEAPALSCSMAP
jgi:hypothetical protein